MANANDQIVISKTVKVQVNTQVRDGAGSSSRVVSVVEEEKEYEAQLSRNGYYYIPELDGWVFQNNTVLVSDNSENSTEESDEETQEEQKKINEKTIEQIRQFSEEEKKEIYMQYLNTEYGDVINNDGIGDELLIDNLSGIYGIPYQFSESVDPRSDNSSFGSIYANRIISRMPLLMISPGKVDFMSNNTDGERLAVLDALIGSENESVSGLGDFVQTPGKYYTFAYDSVNYWKYVNAMNNACAVYLGIQDVIININGVSERAGDFHWEKATNNKFDSLMISTESYVTFYTDAETTKSEQYSNSTKASQLADSVNSFSDIAKEINFLVGAHVGQLDWLDPSAITQAIESIGGLGEDLTGSKLVGDIAKEFSVIATGGKLIFPEIWSDSEFTQTFDVKMKFRCPCPNKVSWFLDICVPINHLRALVLPRTPYGEGMDGKKFEDEPSANGYFSPFLVRAFYKGLFNCDMGIVTDLSLSLGKEGSWTLDGLPSEVDVDMTIKDLYNVMAMTSSDQTTSFLNNTMFLNFLASSCGISINKPDLDRSIDLWMMIKTNYWSDKLTGYSFWQKAQQGIQNKLYNLYQGIFRS